MNKGGVGKTTMTTNMSGVLSIEKNSRILIVDTDGQANSTISFSLKPEKIKYSIYDVLVGDKTIDEVKIRIDDNVDIVPANDEMNFLEFDILPNLKEYTKPFNLLKNAIEQIKDQYDYILIDTPPAMGLVTFNVLVASNYVMLPFVPEMYNVKGLQRVVEAIEKFKKKHNPELEIAGVIGMMIDKRTVLHASMLDKAKEYCEVKGIRFFENYIPRSIVFANANAYENRPAVWGRKGKAVQSYYNLVEEIINE
jgi:chromosome partitioning protein